MGMPSIGLCAISSRLNPLPFSYNHLFFEKRNRGSGGLSSLPKVTQQRRTFCFPTLQTTLKPVGHLKPQVKLLFCHQPKFPDSEHLH